MKTAGVGSESRALIDLPETAAVSSWHGRMLLTALLAALMLAGAAGAGWTFRQPLLRALARYGVSLSR
jgi:hypothetical protein